LGDVTALRRERMTVRSRLARLATIGVVSAIVASVGVFSQSGVATAQAGAHRGPTTVAASSGFTCSSDYWCDYIYDNGTGLCFKVSPFAGPGNIPNWASYGCRNVDGSIENNSPFTLRIYYGPNYRDPHACIKPFTKISDLFNYDFNSGSGPHNLVIGNDIASSTISLSACTNPL
jgi:hypothetical protein